VVFDFTEKHNRADQLFCPMSYILNGAILLFFGVIKIFVKYYLRYYYVIN